jgi:predicted DsbA family dithiol-disulfide isomerase
MFKVAVCVLVSAGLVLAQTSKPVAVVNGQTISEAELQNEAASELQRLEDKRAQLLASHEREKQKAVEDALTEIVNEKLLDAEAKKRGITIDDLVRQEVQSKVAAPGEDEIRKFYESNKARINGSFIEVALEIRNYLMEEQRNQTFAALLSKLRKDYGYRSMLEPLRTQVATQGHPAKGPANAPVTIVEFSDFECPYCGGMFPTLQKIESTYKDKIRIVYRQFPLNAIHPRAQKAAEASLCANEQGKFWQLHDAMFTDQQKLTVDDLKQKASSLSMDSSAFATCLDSGKHAAAVRESIVEGSKAGVEGTPALFVNGRYLGGNQPYAEIEKVIEDELARLGK